MTNDYDIVIIGGSLAGRHAALAATQLQAKVALVEPAINPGLIYYHALREIGNLAQLMGDAADLGIYPPQAVRTPENYLNGVNTPLVSSPEESSLSVTWSEAMRYAQGIVSSATELDSLESLLAQGVDVVTGSGHFQSSPQLAFTIGSRLLRSRAYLLASGSVSVAPEIEGLRSVGYLTLANIWQSLNQPNPPQSWVIIGGLPQGIEIAQTLVRLGCSVTLILKQPYILPSVDREIAQLLQAQLEVEGVRILTQTTVTQVRTIAEKKWLQAGDKAIETDEILVAIEQKPNLESLNLAAVGVKWYRHRLVVNEKLQTTNHRIYACGGVIGGYDFPNVANYEAKVALKNILFCPRLTVNYHPIPWAIFSQPMLAQVGLTEAQAKRQYSSDPVLVLRQYFKTVTIAQIQGQITGVCKLIVRESGEILGAAILGVGAGELINLIGLAISQNIPVQQLENLAPIYPSFSEILEQTAREWSRLRLKENIAWQDFLDSFFHFRRDWNL